MGHRRPRRGDVQVTDGRLLEVASLACGDVLMTDLRIQAAYDTWVQTHDLTRLCQSFRIWRTVEYARPLQWAVWGGPVEGEIEALAALLETMSVPWPWVSPVLLTHHFPARYATAFNPARPPRFAWDTEMVETARPARQPRAADLESLRRHVTWWYRHEVKNPPDKIWELTAEEQARTGENWASRRHSTVVQGIQRAKYLLGLFDRYEIDLVGPSVDLAF